MTSKFVVIFCPDQILQSYYTLDILTVVFSYTQAVQYPPVLNA